MVSPHAHNTNRIFILKKAILLNDTATRYHHGCVRVSGRIRTLLAERGISVIASNPAHHDWRRNERVLAALKHSDLIIINGEGTLHGGAKRGAELLEILSADERCGQPVALINTIWQSNPPAWNALLQKCDIVSVRDSRSAAELTEANITHTRLVPDLSLTGPLMPSAVQRDQIVIGDSVRLSCRHALAKAAQHQSAAYIPTKYLRASIWNIRPMSTLLWRLYNCVPFGKAPGFRMAQSEEIYLYELKRTQSHITGRFHGVCLSMLAQAPFLAVISKTTKVQTLIDDAGLDRRRIITAAQLLAQPDLVAPPFSESELHNMQTYIARANLAAKKLFDDIRALL